MSASGPATSLVGKVVLGRYRVLRHLSDGGMGSVYLARSEGAAGFTRTVVVKTIQPTLVGDRTMVDLFVREARIMSNLRHPAIVSVIDFAEEQERLVMVIEYVHGYHLGHWLKFIQKTGRSFPVDIACHVVSQLLRALHYAHTLEVLHRDVTPNNVLIDTDGHIKLADFGIARASTERTGAERKSIKGQFAYLAPELFDGADPTPSTDTYAAAMTLHTLLVGTNELAGRDMKATVARVMNRVPSRVDQVRHGLPAGLADVLAAALNKNSKDRYATAAELADALARVHVGSDAEVAAHVAARVKTDFFDPRLPQLLHVSPLQELEDAWRAPIPEEPEAPEISVGGPSRRGRVAVAGVVGVGVAAVGAALAILRPWRSAPAEPAYVVVQDDSPRVAETSSAPTAAPPSPPSPAPSSSSSSSPAAVPRPRPAHDPTSTEIAARLTQTFARQRPAITSCFRDHAVGITGSPAITLRIEVGTDGHVSSVTLSPPELATTQLGECLTSLARATVFDRQAEPVAFRVPIKARVTD